MRFRNLCRHRGKLCPIHFPYAGEKDGRGRLVGAGQLSRELPPDRFFNKLLQRDWKNGAIEVLFNEFDKQVLGEAIADLVSEPVSVPTEAEEPQVAEAPVEQPAVEEPKVEAPAETPQPEAPAPAEAPVTEEPGGDATPAPKRRRSRRKAAPKVAEAAPEPPAPAPEPPAPAPELASEPVPAEPVGIPQPEPAPTTVRQPEPAAGNAQRPQPPRPPVDPRIGKHHVAPADPRNQTGIPNMLGVDPKVFAGAPIGLADLQRQNAGNK